MAPPIPFASLPGIIQLARSPNLETCTVVQRYTGDYCTVVQSILETTVQSCRVYWRLLEFSEVYKNLLECTDLHCTEHYHVDMTAEG